ncbi:hypothetical protein FAES_1327 [Fibrella aestuarina BUZ 2]|uniref:DUF4034 domain-containing protein n=1 Tax=Fibrella aestuarina BUZ 2 TaxID=1166018 RepID=I0K5D4_9BACT|nr:hypothetical protein [Fibrella aestuarina]CCG99337.1 hypothetical protein FAES_1327 [Fibrella aestuarina BUZ 2]
MKTINSLGCMLALATLLIAAVPPTDPARYQKAMELSIKKIDTAKTKEQFLTGAAQFERIAQAEATEWLPAYWAAYSYAMATARETDKTQKDALLDKMDNWVDTGLRRSANNDELLVLRAMSAQMRLPVDPMNRWMKYGPVIGQSLELAKKQNPANPRVDLVYGQNFYFTPEQFGGGCKKALPYLQSAQQKWKSFVPASSIAPNWGTQDLAHYLGKCQS